MSKGNKVYPVRMPPRLESMFLIELERNNSNPVCVHKTASEFIRDAISEMCSHRRRGRRPRPAALKQLLSEVAKDGEHHE